MVALHPSMGHSSLCIVQPYSTCHRVIAIWSLIECTHVLPGRLRTLRRYWAYSRQGDTFNERTVRSGERVWRGQNTVGVNETWTANHTVRPTFAGQDLRLTYFVYRGSPPDTVSQSTADKVLYLRLDVFPGGATAPQTPVTAGAN